MHSVSPTSLGITRDNAAAALYLGSPFVASDLLLGKRGDKPGRAETLCPVL